MPKQARNKRIQFTPSDALLALLEELSELSSDPVARVAADLLEEAMPVIRGQLEALKVLRDRPSRMEAYLQSYANQTIHEIAQVVMDFPAVKNTKRGAARAVPKP
jgi:hypothetical protein